MHDAQALMALSHPELIQENAWKLADILNSGPEVFAEFSTITMLNIKINETAIATLSFESAEDTDTEEILLKKYQNEWRIMDFD